MKSKSWSKSSGPDQRKGKREKPPQPAAAKAPGTTDLDRPLKLATAQTLASAGYYVRTNVVLSEPRSLEGAKWVADITDIDVMGITHLLDFRADISCVTCKGGSSPSVLHETFALAGVMRYLHAHRGYGVFARKEAESHMIALAQQLDVAVMDDAEWQQWQKRIAGQYPVPRMFEDAIDAAVAKGVDQWTNLAPVAKYVRSEFWFYRDYRNVQGLIARLRKSADSFNGSPLAQYIALDAISLLALAILQLCEAVSTAGVMGLRETVPPYLFGGVATYRHRRDLVRAVEELLRRKNVMEPDQPMPRLDPPYITELMELVLRYCNRPEVAGRVPQYQAWLAGVAAAKVAGADPQPLPTQRDESDYTKKLSLDLIDFVGRATGLPDVLMKELRRAPADPPKPPAAATTSAPVAGVVQQIADAIGGISKSGPLAGNWAIQKPGGNRQQQPDLLTPPSDTKRQTEPEQKKSE